MEPVPASLPVVSDRRPCGWEPMPSPAGQEAAGQAGGPQAWHTVPLPGGAFHPSQQPLGRAAGKKLQAGSVPV